MSKNANKPSEFSQPNRNRAPGQPPQTIKCFIVPVDVMEGIRDALKEAPYKVANGPLQYINTLQVADVPVGPPSDTRQ